MGINLKKIRFRLKDKYLTHQADLKFLSCINFLRLKLIKNRINFIVLLGIIYRKNFINFLIIYRKTKVIKSLALKYIIRIKIPINILGNKIKKTIKL
jgi:hypothetical protein